MHCEFKEAADNLPTDLFDTVCSFLNTDGGWIFLGVNDSGEITGVTPGAVNQLKSDLDFVEKHLNDPFYLEGDMRVSLRDKIFREVISNIIAHREYTDASPATLKIYQERVELSNPNMPYHFGSITPDNLNPHPKNPTLCKFMLQLGRFDELGSGVINVNHYLPLYAKGAKPEFREENSTFSTHLPLAGEISTPEASEKASEKTSEKILHAIRENSHITIAELTEEVGVTSRSVERNIKKLQNDGVLRRVGSARGGYWEVIDND